MSNGPIQRERAAHRMPPTQPSARDRLHLVHIDRPGFGYCGRRNASVTPDLTKVTCADCLAALRADQALESTR